VENSQYENSGDDAELAARIMAAGPARDRHAEALLYQSLAPRIRLYGLKHLREPQAAADLVQDVMLMTLKRLSRGEIRQPDRIASFVLGASRQCVLDIQRSSRRRDGLLHTYSHDFPAFDEATDPRLNALLDTQRLQHCLTQLPERERTVILMTFYDESPAETVARQLNISQQNVRVIRHRGIERLRRCVEGSRP